MPEEILRQVNFTGGELDPKIHSRRDFKGYYSSLAMAENHVFSPQGPIGRRPGFAFIDYIRNPMAALDLSGVTLTAPNGGTAANVVDGDPGTYLETVNAIGTLEGYHIVQFDFGAPVEVSAVDMVDYAAVEPAATAAPEPPPITYPWPPIGPYYGYGGYIP